MAIIAHFELTDLTKIEHLENLAANAWPASEIEYLGQWLLRADNGITRRANSVLPIGSPGIHVDDAISTVIDFYESRGLYPRFQMTPACQPSSLDESLVNHGFSMGLDVFIQTAPIDRVSGFAHNHDIRLAELPSATWLSAYSRMGNYDEKSIKVRSAILRRINREKSFASAWDGDDIVGVCLGVVEDSWLGVFALVVDDSHRRQGIATSLNQGLAEWGKGLGASHVYLQVETRNTSAINFYATLGFETLYKYWYRLLNGE
ncbi:MAG: GNAT family N-acetyltransferase [Promethearchaeota archaeon]